MKKTVQKNLDYNCDINTLQITNRHHQKNGRIAQNECIGNW